MVTFFKMTWWKKVGIVMLWTILIFGFLYFPLIKESYKQSNTITIFLWSGVIDPKVLQQFEKETGIHVNMSCYDGNDELFAKLQTTKGYGYDLVMPSDFMVDHLIKNKMIQPLDKSKLTFFGAIHPVFLNAWFDPGNIYSIPAEWYALGFGVNKTFFKDGVYPEPSWRSVFDFDAMPDHQGVINDIRELATILIYYKYGKIRPINEQEVKEITTIMVQQKKKVEAYTDFRGDYLLASGNCSMVTVSFVYMWKLLERDSRMFFMMPKEGVVLNLENYVIPIGCKKTDLVYTFLNFLFRYDIQKYNFENVVSFSTCVGHDFMSENPMIKSLLMFLEPGSDIPVCIFEDVLTDDQVNTIWTAVKGA